MNLKKSMVERLIDGDDELKNKAGQVLTFNSKKFSLIKQKTRSSRGYEWTEKPFLKNQIKIIKKQKIKIKMQHVNKKPPAKK